MVLLWRNAAKVWRAKGHSNITAADALEARFGTGKGLGRSTIATLGTTEREPCPPDVADFILNELAVLDEETWARHLRETANEPAEVPGTQPREVRDVGKDAATEVPATVHAWLETAKSKLEAVVDAFTSSVRAKLDVIEATIAHVDSRLEVIKARLERPIGPAVRRDGDTQRILRAVYGSAAVTVLVVVSSCVVTSSRQSASPAPNIRINVGRVETADEGQPRKAAVKNVARSEDPAPPREGEHMGERKPRGLPLPATPPKGAAPLPCRGSEETINGGCWMGTKYSPPCPPDLFEHGKGCYILVGPPLPRDGVGGAGQ